MALSTPVRIPELNFPDSFTIEMAKKFFKEQSNKTWDKEASAYLRYQFINRRPENFPANKIVFYVKTYPHSPGRKVFAFVIELQLIDKYLNIDQTLRSVGVSLDKQSSERIASSVMVKKILDLNFNPNMPYTVIGLPNYRGHCFTIPVLVSLFNLEDFVDSLVKMERSIAIIKKQPQCPVLQALYNCYAEYLRCSRYGPLVMEHIPVGIQKKSADEDYSHFKDIEEPIKKKGKRCDLDLDGQLMNLIKTLRKIDLEYETPGGYSCNLIFDIILTSYYEIEKLKIENLIEQTCYFQLKVIYMCSCNGNSELEQLTITPFLKFQAYHLSDVSLQQLINDMTIYSALEFRCANEINGKECGELFKSEAVIDIELIRVPKIIIIMFSGGWYPSDEKLNCYVQLNNIINFTTDEGSKEYQKHSLSYIEDCQDNLTSLQREDEESNDGSEDGVLHTYLVMRGLNRWYEINNSNVFVNNTNRNNVCKTGGGNVIFYREFSQNQKKEAKKPRAYCIFFLASLPL